VGDVLDRVFADLDASGLGILAPQGQHRHDYAGPRRQDVGMLLNRLRSLQVRVRRGDLDPSDPQAAGGDPQAESGELQESGPP
jgi:hypothetical protein